MSSRVEELRRKLEAFTKAGQAAREKTPDFGQMREAISSLQASAASPDRSVTVTAGPGGAVQNIQFTQDALRSSPSALSSMVMSTLQQAVAEAARKQAEIVQEHTGDSDVLDRVLRTQEEMLGAKVDRSPGSSAPVEEDADDYFDDDHYFDRRGH